MQTHLTDKHIQMLKDAKDAKEFQIREHGNMEPYVYVRPKNGQDKYYCPKGNPDCSEDEQEAYVEAVEELEEQGSLKRKKNNFKITPKGISLLETLNSGKN